MIKALTCRRGFSLLSTMPFSSLKPSSNRPTSGLNESDVRDWAKLYLAGKFKEQIPQKQFRYKQEFKDQCIRMRLDGASWDQISRTMNVSPTTVRRWIEEAQKSTSSSSNASEGADKE